MVTAYATAETAIAAMKAGAYDYLLKPFKVDEVGLVVERALERRTLLRENVTLRAEIQGRYRLDRLLGKSAPMTRLFEMIRKIAPARTSVLLVGESGTGKELAARALHELGPRADRRLRGRQLRRHPRVAARVGAVRPRQGRLHRRHRRQGGSVRGGQRRHAVPRRDGRAAASDAGQAAARAAGAAGSSRWAA